MIVQATGNALTKAVTAAEAGGMVESLWKFGNFHKEICFFDDFATIYHDWVVVSKISYFHPYLGR